MQEIDPAHRAVYEANFQNFVASIERIDTELKRIFIDQEGLRFMVFHPSWGYFAHAYGIKQVPVEMEGKEPKPAQLQELIQHARHSQIKVIFVQPQFAAKSAKLIAREINGEVVVADPLSENWLENLREAASKFKAALK